MSKLENTDQLIAAIVDALENIKGEDIRILDLRDIENAVCKYFIICSGGSNTQVNALAGSVQKQVSKSLREKPFQVEGTETAEWCFWIISTLSFIFFKNLFENTMTSNPCGAMQN